MGFPKPWPTDWPTPGLPDADSPGRERESPSDSPDAPFGEPDDGPDSFPEFRRNFYSVTWAVNHACNLRCTHCYDVVPFQRSDLSTDDSLRLIDRLNEAGVAFVAFSGGEAFLRKDLFRLMAHCRERGMLFGARSNGTRITAEVARTLKELGISVVGVSFDGATPEVHDAVRGAGAFHAAVAGIQALIAEGIRSQVEVVLSLANAHQAIEFIEFGESIGASEVNFSAMTPQGRGAVRAKDLLDHGTWLRLTQVLRGASRSARIPVTPNCAFFGPCFANVEPHVTCDGWMSPCYLSSAKLFRILETPAELIGKYLRRDRPRYQDVCGRGAWLHDPARV